MSTPSFTAAQFVAVVTAVINTAVAFGFSLSANQEHVILADAALIGALLAADFGIRHGRSKVAAVIAAQAVAPKAE